VEEGVWVDNEAKSYPQLEAAGFLADQKINSTFHGLHTINPSISVAEQHSPKSLSLTVVTTRAVCGFLASAFPQPKTTS
jgi:hypothetical protein